MGAYVLEASRLVTTRLERNWPTDSTPSTATNSTRPPKIGCTPHTSSYTPRSRPSPAYPKHSIRTTPLTHRPTRRPGPSVGGAPLPGRQHGRHLQIRRIHHLTTN
jgi:hypothetical protein